MIRMSDGGGIMNYVQFLNWLGEDNLAEKVQFTAPTEFKIIYNIINFYQECVKAWTSRIDGQETPKNGKNYWGLMRFFWCCDKTVRDNFKIPFGYWGATISADSWTKEMLKSHKRSPHGLLAPKKLHFPKIGLFIPELKIFKSIWCWCLIICFLGQQVQ